MEEEDEPIPEARAAELRAMIERNDAIAREFGGVTAWEVRDEMFGSCLLSIEQAITPDGGKGALLLRFSVPDNPAEGRAYVVAARDWPKVLADARDVT